MQNAGFKSKLNFYSILAATAFHIVIFLNLDNLKKHLLRLRIPRTFCSSKVRTSPTLFPLAEIYNKLSMKRILSIILVIPSMFLFGQIETDDSDKMIDEMCLDFKSTENLNDSLRVVSLNEKFIFPFLKKFPNSEREDKIDFIYFRFQKRCEYFRAYLQEVDPPKDNNWVKLNEKPKISISEKEIKEFKANKNFYYFEYAGEKTFVKTDKKYWTETFADKTNSKLIYKWIDKNRFELEFVESTNNTRKNFSIKGDKFLYQIVNKEKGYYWILCEIPGQSEILKFKLFPEK